MTRQIFISYASADGGAALQLQKELERLGFHVWRDQTRLEFDWSREISEALTVCEMVCLLWSKHASRSIWVRHEWLTARALGKYIAPCFLDDERNLPAPIENLHGLDLTDLRAALPILVGRITSRTERQVRYEHTIVPPRTYIPFSPNPRFVGRDRDLVELYRLSIVGLNNSASTRVGITGMGGIGKTQLAVEFSFRFAFAFTGGIIWIDASDPNFWVTRIAKCARDQLHLSVKDPVDPDAEKRYVAAFQTYCTAGEPVLLVMDNVPDAALLNDESVLDGTTALTLGCNILFTTRDRLTLPSVAFHHVNALNEDDGCSFLAQARPPGLEEQPALVQVYRAVGGLPLALVLAAGYLRNYPEIGYDGYLQALRADKLGALDSAGLVSSELATRHAAAVEVTLRTQLARLDDAIALSVFRTVSLFPESAMIPKARLRLLAEAPRARDGPETQVTRAINLLVRLSLMEEIGRNREAIRMHPLVRSFALDSIQDSERSSIRATAAERLVTAYQDARLLYTEYKSRGIDELVDDAVTGLEWASSDTQVVSRLSFLRHLLNREHQHFSPDNALISHMDFFQQLHYRAVSMGEKIPARRFADELSSSSELTFRLVHSTKTESVEWLRRLKGHSGSIYSVDISGSGERMLSGSEDFTAIVWDARSGRIVRKFTGHNSNVRAVSISADGQYALTGAFDGSVLFWKCDSGQVIHSLAGHTQWVTSTRILKGGSPRALTASQEGCVILWDLHSGEQLFSVTLPAEGMLTDAHISPDGQHIFGAHNFSGVSVWDVMLGKLERRIATEDLLACVSDTGLALTFDLLTHAVSAWDAYKGSRKCTWRADSLASPCIAPDGSFAISGSNTDLIVWDLRSGKLRRAMSGHVGDIMSAAVSADSRYVVTGQTDWTIMLWDLHSSPVSGHQLRRLRADRQRFGTVAASAWGGVTAIRRASSRLAVDIILWDARKFKRSRTELSLNLKEEIADNTLHGLAISQDGAYVAAGAFGYFRVWNARTGEVVCEHRTHGWVNDLAFSPSGRHIFVADGEQIVRWAIDSAGDSVSYDAQSGVVAKLDISVDGSTLLSGGFGNIVHVWDVDTRRLRQELHGHDSWIVSVQCTRSGLEACSASADQTIILWDLVAGVALRRIDCGAQLKQAVFLGDERHVVTIGHDDSIAMWDLLDGTLCRRLFLNASPASFAIIDTRILLTDTGGALHAFDVRRGRKPFRSERTARR